MSDIPRMDLRKRPSGEPLPSWRSKRGWGWPEVAGCVIILILCSPVILLLGILIVNFPLMGIGVTLGLLGCLSK
jgi:hypothetical protein